jgi:Core-2/I-Branching enzyme
MPDRARVAYVITSYKLPNQVLRLASILRKGSPDASIVVHHDDRGCTLDPAQVEALDVRLVEPPSHVVWGEASQLAMVLRCLGWALDHDGFDWLVLLSGQDYPIRPVAEIEQSLAAAEVDAFIETRPCERSAFGATIDEFAGRYHFRWRRMPTGVAASLARVPARGRSLAQARTMPTGTWVGVRALRSPFGHHLICHRGSDWFTLSRAAVECVDKFVRTRRDVLDYYRHTLIPTESFVQTVLANSSLRLSGDYRRYLVFDGPQMPAPRVLRMQDLTPMLASGGNFARKFDETIDRAVLDEIDRRVHSS